MTNTYTYDGVKIMVRIVFFFMFAFLVFALANMKAHAQTPVSREMADTYYQNCVSKPDARMDPETQNIFCQCTKMFTQTYLSVEDMQAMAGNDQKARLALNKMMNDVYAPCMEFPVRDLIFKSCLEKMSPEICRCLANNMGRYTAEKAQEFLGDILKKNPNIVDPMTPIMERPEFTRMEQQMVTECVNNNH